MFHGPSWGRIHFWLINVAAAPRFRLMPILWLMCESCSQVFAGESQTDHVPLADVLNYVDRTNIGLAKVGGMSKDLELLPTDYSVALLIFFVGYRACSSVANGPFPQD